MNYVAMIRGIMPGKPNMSNANLCRVIESLGCKNVKAIISSGNVIFTLHKMEADIEKAISQALKTELNIPGHALVRPQTELSKLLADKPFGEQAHSQDNYLSVTFFSGTATPPVLEHPKVNVVRSTKREVCLSTKPAELPGPEAMRILQKTYGNEITTRTWKTVERIVQKMQEIT